MTWLMLALALGQDLPPDENPESDDAEQTDEDRDSEADALPSALDEFSRTSRENLADPDAGRLSDLLPMSEQWGALKGVWGGGWYVRPRMAVMHGTTRDDAFNPGWLGLRVGRRGFQLDRDVGLSWDASFAAEFPTSPRTQGRDLSGSLIFGLNSERLGIRVGPGVVHNQILFDGPGPLAAASGITARADVVAKIAKVGLFVGAEPVWWLTEGRAPVANFVGDEFIWHGGLAVGALALDVSHRMTAVGSIQRVGLGLRIFGG